MAFFHSLSRLAILLLLLEGLLATPLFSQKNEEKRLAPSPTANGVFLVPSGFGPEKGEVYYQNLTVFFNQVQYGASDQFSLGLSFELLSLFAALDSARYRPGFTISPKVTVPVEGQDIQLGFGAMFVEIPDTDEFLDLGFVLGTGTYGQEDRHISLGLGFGLVEGEFSVQPIYLLSGQYRLTRRWYFISENIWIPAAKLGMFNLGLRARGRQVHWDLGLILSGERGKPFDRFPILGLVVPIP
ncbi:MAG: hypothetical protein HRU41_26615 [Saprospiraceae bacterium]|nr:hypothetical protein [Saprospiraceae bacterium]